MQQNLVFKYFAEICKIPHVSGNEQALGKYIVSVLKQSNCEIKIDKIGNVYASRHVNSSLPGICFQAHLDMVGEKSSTSSHNFQTDPIKFYEKDGWIQTQDTTLGADDGIGIALILALLTDTSLPPRPLETVFTVQEETTTMGAIKLNNQWIKSPYLINLDSEDDRTIVIGNGGCCDFNGWFAVDRKSSSKQSTSLSIKIFNGTGGHSGINITDNTINVIVEIFNILQTIKPKYVFRLIDIKTTNTLNAIPNFCEVIININKSYINKFKKDFSRYFQILLNTYKDSEKNLSLDFNNVKTSLHPLTLNDTSKLMDVVLAVNNGLNNYDVFFKTPRVSTNLGKLVITQNQVHLGWLQRSNDDYDLDKLNNKLISLFNLVGGKYQIANRTSGLKPNNSNRLALQIKNIAQTQFHRQIAIVAVHAVLEMGDIVKHYPKIIPASIGANIQNPHTVNERVEIQSILYTYELLKEIIKHVQ